ncbi:MAG: right-handed parallel beta-helix repeat-containing protein [Clostridia bacterium]|nr:right-handed parallel beta-helix repeat-containing protein [Clostridia bacterium]
MKYRRNAFDKLNTLLFGKDLRITEGDRYTEEREFDYSSYCPVEKYVSSVPLPDENAYYITDFGARANDKTVDNSVFINRCVDECSKNGGGTVIVRGGEYTAKTVILKSNVTLFVCPDSVLIAEESGEGFEKPALIYASGAKNVSLTGGGVINGNGHLFGRKPLFDKNLTEPDDIIDVIKMRRDNRAQLRFAHPSKYGKLVCFEDCEDIKINNVILKDSAYWTLKLTRCKNAVINNLAINNNRHVANTDGIDLMQSSDVIIKDCFISTADDGIVLKNAVWDGCFDEMKNVSVSGCEIISRTNAFKIGTETTNAIKNVTVENCRFFMTDIYPGSVSGISLESADGAKVENITIRNIEMNRCTCPVFIRLCNRNRASKVNEQSASAIEFGVKAKGKGLSKKTFDMKGEVKNILIENVKAESIELPVIIAGFRQKGKIKRVKNITLKNFDLTYANKREIIDRRLFIPEYSKTYPECWRFRNLPAYALWARHAENLKTENFRCSPADGTWKKEKILKDVK